MNLDLNTKRTINILALGLFVLTIVTRLPFQSQYLYHWDSVNMAFGIREFNVIAEAPQYPGYIVYIALSQVVNVFFNDPQRTMVLISMVSSGLAVAAMFYLGRDLFNSVTGLIAALFLLTSPLVWFYGEIALPHTLDLFAVILSIWLLYKVMLGQTRWLWATVIVLALVGGFRQQTLMFLAPAALLAVYRVGIRRIVLAGGLGIVVTAAWFIPLMAYSGGFQSYMAGSAAYSSRFFDSTSLLAGAGWFGLRRNLINKLIPYTLYAWSLALLPALYWFGQLPRHWRAGLTNRKVWFILLWIAPALGFYTFIHMGQQGLVFVFLPALLLVSAEGLFQLLQSRPMALRTTAAAIVLVNAVVFVLGPTYPLGENGPKLLSAQTLREHDRLLENQITTIRQNFPPDNTLLVAGTWRFVEYYLPEYRFVRFVIGGRYEIDAGQVANVDHANQPMTAEQLGLQPGTDWRIVVVDADLNIYSAVPLETVKSATEFEMGYAPMAADEVYFTDGQSFGGQAS